MMDRTVNPFTLDFGKIPMTLIDRQAPKAKIINTFTTTPITGQIFVLSGVRGVGKTVLLSEVKASLAKQADWITIELNSSRNLIQSLLKKLYGARQIGSFIKAAKLDLSFFGLGVAIESGHPIYDEETAIENLLAVAKKQQKRVLITIDEVSNTQAMREFASFFQILMREKYPVFLLMTGLYENISELQNEDNLTFLYRTPRITLEPLNPLLMANKYREKLGISFYQAENLAKLSNGYPFAFQILGNVVWGNPAITEADLLNELDGYLQDFVYQKVWTELSNLDRDVLMTIIRLGANEVEEVKIGSVREKMDMQSGKMAVYCDRLIKKGLIKAGEYGFVKLALPRFDVFAKKYFDD